MGRRCPFSTTERNGHGQDEAQPGTREAVAWERNPQATAELIVGATDGRRKPAKQVRAVVRDMTELLNDVEDRVSGGPAKRKAAANEAAQTRKHNAAKRSASAKKAARTRAKSHA
jgi:hypothetical protein